MKTLTPPLHRSIANYNAEELMERAILWHSLWKIKISTIIVEQVLYRFLKNESLSENIIATCSRMMKFNNVVLEEVNLV